MNLDIRRAKEEDFETLQELYRHVDTMHHQAHPRLFKPYDPGQRTTEFIRETMAQDDTILLVAEYRGRVIGFILAAAHRLDHPLMIPQKLVHIHEVVVEEHFHGAGVAMQLVDQVDNWARGQNARQLQLNVFEFNRRAIAFYEKAGFKTSSRRMWRDVTPLTEEQHGTN